VTEPDRERWGTISRAEAEQILLRDLGTSEGEVNRDVRVPLTQNMFDALTSLMFNLGPSNFDKPRVGPLLKEGDYLGAARDFERLGHVHGHGRLEVSAGLANRRRAEDNSSCAAEVLVYARRRPDRR
jgi:lysozyme